MIGLALLWVACPLEIFAITVGILTNTTITAVLSKEGTTECVYGETITIVAQVSPIAGATAPSGTVQFLHNGFVIGSASLAAITNSNISLAQLVTSNLGTAGYADLTASYLGNSSPAFFSSSSPTVQETVTLANTTTSVSSGGMATYQDATLPDERTSPGALSAALDLPVSADWSTLIAPVRSFRSAG